MYKRDHDPRHATMKTYRRGFRQWELPNPRYEWVYREGRCPLTGKVQNHLTGWMIEWEGGSR